MASPWPQEEWNHTNKLLIGSHQAHLDACSRHHRHIPSTQNPKSSNLINITSSLPTLQAHLLTPQKLLSQLANSAISIQKQHHQHDPSELPSVPPAPRNSGILILTTTCTCSSLLVNLPTKSSALTPHRSNSTSPNYYCSNSWHYFYEVLGGGHGAPTEEESITTTYKIVIIIIIIISKKGVEERIIPLSLLQFSLPLMSDEYDFMQILCRKWQPFGEL